MTEKTPRNPEDILSGELPLYTMAEAENFLYAVLPDSPKALFKEGEGFYRSKYFMRELGDPQNRYKTVHIAGTSGKGSTSYYLSALLHAHGFTVGTHVSPHVYDLRERSMINLELPDERDFLRGINVAVPTIRSMDNLETGRPTYFEVTTGNAFTLFAHKHVDYAVIETGLGGKYDSTNTITRQDKLSVITKIGLDHTEVLGDTVEKIAYQKAGIFIPGGQAMIIDQPPNILNVFKAEADAKNVDLEVVSPMSFVEDVKLSTSGVTFNYKADPLLDDCFLPTIAKYQIENALLAIEVCKKLAQRDGFEFNAEGVKEALKKTIIPARSEVRQLEGRGVLLDGAHNPQKVSALIDSIKSLKLPTKPIWVLAFKKDKDAESMLRMILPNASRIICSEFFADAPINNLKDYAMSATFLKDLVLKIDPKMSVEVAPEPNAAVNNALKVTPKDNLIVVTGSIYFLSELDNI